MTESKGIHRINIHKVWTNECHSAATLLKHEQKMSKTDGAKSSEEIEEMTRVPYQLIGSLMHLTFYTRPDIMNAVTKLFQFNANPGRAHWTQAKHVLRYLSRKPKPTRSCTKPSTNAYNSNP